MFAIRFVPTAALGSADAGDLDWRPVRGEYPTELDAWIVCDELDSETDGAFTHRPFEVANDR